MLLSSAISKNSLAQYRNKWFALKRFMADSVHLTSPPYPPQAMCMFFALLYNDGLGISTIRSYASAAAYYHKLLGYADPTKTFRVKTVIAGIGRKRPPASPARRPITKAVLKSIVSNCKFSTESRYSELLFRALFLFTYHACLRAGETVFSNHANHVLDISQVVFVHDNPARYNICFKTFKHCPSLHSTNFVLRGAKQPEFCPVKSLSEYLAVRPKVPGPVFVNKLGLPITRFDFAKTLKSSIQLAGLDPSLYNCHSLRIGRATQLAQDNVDHNLIKQTGRWRSSAYLRYIKPDHLVLPE